MTGSKNTVANLNGDWTLDSFIAYKGPDGRQCRNPSQVGRRERATMRVLHWLAEPSQQLSLFVSYNI